MLQVTVEYGPRGNKLGGQVQIWGFDKLTPRAARAALQIAGAYDGTVWWTDPNDEHANMNGCPSYGYRVYPKSARKLYPFMDM